jgi:hypothetical protein
VGTLWPMSANSSLVMPSGFACRRFGFAAAGREFEGAFNVPEVDNTDGS